MLKKLLATSALLASTMTAYANPVQIAYVGGNQVYATQVSINGSTRWEGMGTYTFKNADNTTFTGFCVDPYQAASKMLQTYDKSSLDVTDFSNNGSTRFTNVQKLFDNAYGTALDTRLLTGGFHLALWELFADDGNLSTGNVKVDPNLSGNADVFAQAKLLLSSLSNWTVTNTYGLTFFKNDCYQDYLTVTRNPSAVPIPAALPLMASGLAAFGFARRRKQSV